MISPRILTPTQLDSFRRDGYLLVRSFYDVAQDICPILNGVYSIIGQVMKRHGIADQRAPFELRTFDDGYQPLLEKSRSYGGEVYDAVKQIPAFVRLLGDPRHEQLFRELRSDAVPGVAAGGYGIRIDNPREDRYRAEWHQEYPSQLRSLDGLVFWSPLLEITPDIGPVRLCPGSHLNGPVPVQVTTTGEKSGAYGLRLENEAALLAEYEQIEPLTHPGDLLLVDFLTLHASGYNCSERSRWSLQFRYFNFNEPTGLSHGWKGSFAAGVDFRAVHPELCAQSPRHD